MLEPLGLPPLLPAHVCQRALDARDARFDGLFYVGIVTTGIYCRPTYAALHLWLKHDRTSSGRSATAI